MVKSIRLAILVSVASMVGAGCNGYHDIFPINTLTPTTYYVNRSSGALLQNGKKDSPFKSIQTAIEYAFTTGVQSQVLVSAGTYNEPIVLRNGVSLYGGYDASFGGQSTSTNTVTLSSPTSTTIYADSTVSNSTIVDGFTIQAGTLGGSNQAIYLNGGHAVISNNTITGGAGTNSTGVSCAAGCRASITANTIDGGSGSTLSIGILVQSSDPTISLNTITGGTSANHSRAIDINAGSSPVVTRNTLHGGYAANISYGINNMGSPTISNNVIYGGNGPSSRAITNDGNPVIANNVLHAGTGSLASASAIYSNTSSFPVVTNNIFVANSAFQMAFFEQTTTATARSLENNAFWDFNGSSTLTVYYNCTAGSCSGPDIKTTISAVELLTDWGGGADKARGNLLLTAGTTGNPFVNIPRFWDRTTGAGTTTTIVTGQFNKYTNGDYVEINGDGVARQITGCAGVCAASPITFTPARSSATTTSMEVRNWGTRSAGGSQYAVDYRLAQNSLAASVWSNLRYGGKNTATANCGAPAGGAGTGAGGENCGTVTLDRDGRSRTTDNAGLATNNAVPNAAVGASAAVPGGFSIGAYETD